MRAVAVVAVIGAHTGIYGPAAAAAVTGFFVLSGFIITNVLLDGKVEGRIQFRAFYVRRARRLVPALVPVVVAGLAVNKLRYEVTVGDAVAALTFTSNAWNVAGHGQGALGHLWSLAVEEHFYLVWPLLLAVVRRPLAVCVAMFPCGLVAAGLVGPSVLTYRGTPFRFGEIALGAAVALWWRAGRRIQVPTWVGVVLVGAGLVTATSYWTPLGPMFVAPGAAILVVRSLTWTRAPGRWVGRRSYGIYLWHYPVTVMVSGPFEFPVVCAVTFLLAAGSWRWIEQPFLTGATSPSSVATPRTVATRPAPT